MHVITINSTTSLKFSTTTFTGSTPGLPGTSVSFQPMFSGASLTAAGLVQGVTIACTGTWALSGANATVNSSGSVIGLRMSIGKSCSFTSRYCTITFAPQTLVNGITGQDRNAADSANATPSTAGSVRVIFTNAGPVSGTGSSGCASIGVPTSFTTASYSGTTRFYPHAFGSTNYIGLWAISG